MGQEFYLLIYTLTVCNVLMHPEKLQIELNKDPLEHRVKRGVKDSTFCLCCSSPIPTSHSNPSLHPGIWIQPQSVCQHSSSDPINKTIKCSTAGAKKYKTESPRKWVGLDQNSPSISQRILQASVPKAPTTSAFQPSCDPRPSHGSVGTGQKLNKPHMHTEQHFSLWSGAKKTVVPLRQQAVSIQEAVC